jgi:negative regulator of flagellin synthesis FlgM
MDTAMNSPISAYARQLGTGSLDRYNNDRLDKASDKAAAKSAAAASPGDDQLVLSDVAKQAMSEGSFDRAKVDAIKQAIQDGQYPLNARRIAESFVAIEQMIKG